VHGRARACRRLGYGSHACFGDQLGRLEIRVVLEALLDQIEQLALTGPVAWAASNKHTVVSRMPVTLAAGAGASVRSRAGGGSGVGKLPRWPPAAGSASRIENRGVAGSHGQLAAERKVISD